jgi:uncharacterized membrane protein YfcA
MSAASIGLALVVVALASGVQAATGFGFALVSMPLLSAVAGPESALAITSLLSIANSGATAVTARAHAERPTLRRQVLAAFVGMPLGLVVLESVSAHAMELVIACTVAVSALLLGAGVRLRHAGPRTEVAVGFTSGVLATSTGTSGPPLVIALQSKALPAPVVRATLSAQFAITGWVSVVLLAVRHHIDREDVVVAVAALPILLVSWTIGASSFRRLSQRRYDAIVVALLLAAATAGAIRSF